MDQNLKVMLTVWALHLAVTISPGPNFALVSRLALKGRRASAFAAALGFAVGGGAYAALSMFGLGILVLRVEWLANFVQFAGGSFLIYLGVKSWITAASAVPGSEEPDRGDLRTGFVTGLLVELSNVKGIAFFLGLYAASVPPQTELWVKLTILLGSFFIENAWYGLVAVVMASKVAQNSYARFGIWIERGIGILLTVFGLKVLIGLIAGAKFI